MTVGRLVIGLIVIVVLYAVVTQPVEMAQTTRGGVSQLGVAGDRVTQFVMALFDGTSSQGVVPTGGAAAGDGTSAR